MPDPKFPSAAERESILKELEGRKGGAGRTGPAGVVIGIIKLHNDRAE